MSLQLIIRGVTLCDGPCWCRGEALQWVGWGQHCLWLSACGFGRALRCVFNVPLGCIDLWVSLFRGCALRGLLLLLLLLLPPPPPPPPPSSSSSFSSFSSSYSSSSSLPNSV